MSTTGRFSSVFDLPRQDIRLDPARFQGRQGEYSEETVNAIVSSGRFDPTVSALVVWKDPDSGKYFLLSGHSRYEAAKRLYESGKQPELTSLPVKELMNATEEEAVEYATIESNRRGTEEGLISDLKAYRLAVNSGKNATQLKRLFRPESKLRRLQELSYLNPRGMFIEQLAAPSQQSFPYLERNARWVGDMRRQLPTLTDAHERELFDYLYGSKKGLNLDKAKFYDLVNNKVNRLDFDPELALNLHDRISPTAYTDPLNEQMRELDKEIDTAQKEIDNRRATMARANAEGVPVPKYQGRITFEERIAELNRHIIRLIERKEAIRQSAGKVERTMGGDLFSQVEQPKAPDNILSKEELEAAMQQAQARQYRIQKESIVPFLEKMAGNKPEAAGTKEDKQPRPDSNAAAAAWVNSLPLGTQITSTLRDYGQTYTLTEVDGDRFFLGDKDGSPLKDGGQIIMNKQLMFLFKEELEAAMQQAQRPRPDAPQPDSQAQEKVNAKWKVGDFLKNTVQIRPEIKGEVESVFKHPYQGVFYYVLKGHSEPQNEYALGLIVSKEDVDAEKSTKQEPSAFRSQTDLEGAGWVFMDKNYSKEPPVNDLRRLSGKYKVPSSRVGGFQLGEDKWKIAVFKPNPKMSMEAMQAEVIEDFITAPTQAAQNDSGSDEQLPNVKGVTVVEYEDGGKTLVYGTKSNKTRVSVVGLSQDNIKEELDFERRTMSKNKDVADNLDEKTREVRYMVGLTPKEKNDVIAMLKSEARQYRIQKELIVPFLEKMAGNKSEVKTIAEMTTQSDAQGQSSEGVTTPMFHGLSLDEYKVLSITYARKPAFRQKDFIKAEVNDWEQVRQELMRKQLLAPNTAITQLGKDKLGEVKKAIGKNSTSVWLDSFKSDAKHWSNAAPTGRTLREIQDDAKLKLGITAWNQFVEEGTIRPDDADSIRAALQMFDEGKRPGGRLRPDLQMIEDLGPADPQEGFYYVTAADGGHGVYMMLGPFAKHADAISNAYNVQKVSEKEWKKYHPWIRFGTARMVDKLPYPVISAKGWEQRFPDAIQPMPEWRINVLNENHASRALEAAGYSHLGMSGDFVHFLKDGERHKYKSAAQAANDLLKPKHLWPVRERNKVAPNDDRIKAMQQVKFENFNPQNSMGTPQMSMEAMQAEVIEDFITAQAKKDYKIDKDIQSDSVLAILKKYAPKLIDMKMALLSLQKQMEATYNDELEWFVRPHVSPGGLRLIYSLWYNKVRHSKYSYSLPTEIAAVEMSFSKRRIYNYSNAEEVVDTPKIEVRKYHYHEDEYGTNRNPEKAMDLTDSKDISGDMAKYMAGYQESIIRLKDFIRPKKDVTALALAKRDTPELPEVRVMLVTRQYGEPIYITHLPDDKQFGFTGTDKEDEAVTWESTGDNQDALAEILRRAKFVTGWDGLRFEAAYQQPGVESPRANTNNLLLLAKARARRVRVLALANN